MHQRVCNLEKGAHCQKVAKTGVEISNHEVLLEALQSHVFNYIITYEKIHPVSSVLEDCKNGAL